MITPSPHTTLSVVTTLYRSAPHLDEFHHRISTAAAAVTDRYEIILVHDGSPDESLDVARRIQSRDPQVRVVDLSRNFGHHPALMAGLRRARGDLVFLIDSDLEEAPEWLAAFRERMLTTGADAVYGVQRRRKGGWVERMTGWIFYHVIAGPLHLPWPKNVVTARLMTRRFVSALTQFHEREMAFQGLFVLTGFAQEAVTVDKRLRHRTTYGLRLRASALVNAVTSFSNRPLVLIFYLGCLLMATSGLAGLTLIWRWIVGGIGVPGYTSLVVSVWFLGGATIFCIGLVGLYLAKVFVEVKQRPEAIVRVEYSDSESLESWTHQPH